MRSTSICLGLSARWGLWVLLVAAAGCGAFRQSPCVDAPMQTGCQVTMSVAPGRIVGNQAVTLLLNFKEEGLGKLLGSLPNPPQVLLVQGNTKVEPGKPVVTAAGGMTVMLSEELMRKLSPGEVQLSLSTDGGSVTAKLRIYAEPRLIAAYVEPTTTPTPTPRKWAGLRTSPGKIVLLEADQKTNPTTGHFVEYALMVNSSTPSMSMLSNPMNVQHSWQFMPTPLISKTQYYFLTAPSPPSTPQINRVNGNNLVTIASPAAPDAAVYLDTNSDLMALVTNQGFKVYQDTGAPTLVPSSAPNLLGVQRLAAADLNQDGYSDILAWADITGGVSPPALHILLHQDNGSFKEETALATALNNRLSGLGPILGLTTGDLDGDGMADLLVATTNNVQWLPLDGSLNATILTNVSALGLKSIQAAYLDSDGLADLAVVTNSGFTLYLNTALR